MIAFASCLAPHVLRPVAARGAVPISKRLISTLSGLPLRAPRSLAPCRLQCSATMPPAASTSSVPAEASNPSAAPARVKVRSVHDATAEIVGSSISVCGWVRSVRDQKAFAFVDVNDGSALAGLQVVVDAESDAFATVSELTTGCSVSIVGTVVESLGKGQRFELKASRMRVLGTADATYPLQKKRHSLEFLRTIAHLRPRTNAIGAMARVRSVLATSTHAFFDQNGFLYLHTPIITASDCEGAGEMFRVTTTIPEDGAVSRIPLVAEAGAEGKEQPSAGATPSPGSVDFSKDFFSRPAFLTVSGQLSAETYACALSDVYTFGPTFRAENSNTTRHLAEFWMIEPEMAFATLEDDMTNAESYVKHVVQTVMDRCVPDLEFFDKFVEKGLLDKLSNVLAEPFGRITYTEAVDLLVEANRPNKKGKRRFEFPVEWGLDLQSEHEKYIAEEHFKRPVFVFNYPSAIKAFYMRGNDDDGGKTVQAMDLLVPGIGELIGGSAREERLDVLESKIESLGLDAKDYDWYLDLRRYGSVPHAGYGLGFERLVQFVTGIVNIRDAIPYPRYPGSAAF